ncbi:probable WRKY transcription factor 2 [Musa acuminata AAA Group]|uniref:probable WRKY transcription factor 2 n=1 Tax=Musa acuminata AAA Group TaxID=214697 RepID=UPI0031D32EC1
MAGMNDKDAMIEDWTLSNPSPRTLMSTFLSEEFGSRSSSGFLAGKENDGPALETEKMDKVTKEEEGEASNDFLSESNWSGAHKSNSHGGLAERISASGFNVPKLNTARIGQEKMASSSSDVRSPYLTIPPGLSPTSLLESPVFLSNSMAQPSPTTGKLHFAQNNIAGPALMSVSSSRIKSNDLLEDAPEAFAFKPLLELHSSFYSSSERMVAPGLSQPQTLSSITVPVQLGKPKETGTLEAGPMNSQNQHEFNLQADSKDATDSIMFKHSMPDSFMGSDHALPLDDEQDGDRDLKGEPSSVAVGAPAKDGYNWRKYGQKQVKGSEYPRSYYKCTHPNCQVKKKVERSLEGHITEIIYKGTHNHPMPPPNRRSGVLLSHPFNDPEIDGSAQTGSQMNSDSKTMWTTRNMGNEEQDWQGDGLETTTSTHVAAECCDPSATTKQTPDIARLSSDAIDVSSTMSNEEDEDDRATHGSVSLGCDGEGDETESKRMKLDTTAIEMSAASRAVREPRVVVQTTSEVDILDDGYRWRKYGQKVVKGNPNPRSYYKCTHPGCNVRKHVERAAHDLKSVITTYEGKHNHDVPAARNSNHPGSIPSGTISNTAAPHEPHGLLPRVESAQGGLVRLEGHAPFSTFGLPGTQQLRPATSFSFAMSQPGFTNLAMALPGPLAPMNVSVLPSVHSYLGHHMPVEGLMIPKGEPKEEPMPESESRLPMPNAGPMYHQMMMNGVPLRPQL